VRENLRNSFPDIKNDQLRKILKEVYINFACLWIEIIQSRHLTDSYINKHFRIHGWEEVEKASELHKGIIFLTAHLGNFEWLGYYLSMYTPQLNAIMLRVRNPKINQFVEKNRKKFGVTLVYTRGALKKCLLALRRGENLGIVGDQDAREKGIFVDFFNRPSSTARGSALLHLETGAPIIFCMGIRRKWGDFDLYFERIPDFTQFADRETAVFRITQTHTRLLEKRIKQYPGQYFWTHRRWKTIPTEEELADYQRMRENLI
jgi:KDO2-lipid IV(A) lauroyltransferase